MSEQLFVIPWNMYITIDLDELKLLSDDLKEMGLFKFPYPLIDILLKDKFGQDYIKLKDCELNPDDGYSVTSTFEYIPPPKTNKQSPEVRASKDTGSWHLLRQQNLDRDYEAWAGYRDDKGYRIANGQLTLVHILIGFLTTKNVVKKTTSNKRAKLGIGKKANRGYNKIVHLQLPTYLQDIRDRDGNIIGKPKRPHLRRGHIRRQRWGPKMEFIKKIWIDSVFVNRDDYNGGSLDHTYVATDLAPDTIRHVDANPGI